MGAKAKKKVEKPENLPKKPPVGHALLLFRQAKSKELGTNLSHKETNEHWLNLGVEGQKPYNDEATAALVKYKEEMVEFAKTPQGKKYLKATGKGKLLKT